MSNMASTYITDNGKFHKRFVQFTLRDGEILIRYPDKNFLPLTALLIDGMIYLNAAMVGSLGDIKLTAKEWFKVLKVLNSSKHLQQWEEQIKNKQLA